VRFVNLGAKFILKLAKDDDPSQGWFNLDQQIAVCFGM
jgi:hypothetical protein